MSEDYSKLKNILTEVKTVDKNEYRAKLDVINDLVDRQDYKGALEIVDTLTGAGCEVQGHSVWSVRFMRQINAMKTAASCLYWHIRGHL